MIIKDEILKKLRSVFDLNIYEVKIWTALLSRGTATAGELSDISNVPRSRSYDVLESLEKKGFIIMRIGKPIKYIAVPPQEVIKRVKNSIRLASEEKLKTVGEVRETEAFRDINLLFTKGIEHLDPSALSGAIKGRYSIYNHLDFMLENASKNVIIVTTPEGFKRKAEYLKKTFKKLKEKGVKIRVATKITDEVKNIAKEYKGIFEIRDLSDQPGRFVVIDGKELLFLVNDDKSIHESSDIAIWVNTPFFASAMASMLEANWNKLEKI